MKIEWGERDGEPKSVANKSVFFLKKKFCNANAQEVAFLEFKRKIFFATPSKVTTKIKRHYLYPGFQPQGKRPGRRRPTPK